jgi:hypothetical protein
LSLAVTTTVLVMWVVEPSAMRLLGRWLHAPALREREQLHASEFLWRVRVVINDQPGALEHITRELAAISVSILSLHVHPLENGVMDEIIVGADASVDQADLAEAVRRAGVREIRIWPTTASALVDGQTHALTLAARVSHQPEALPGAVAELLGARLITGSARTPGPETNTHDLLAGTVLRIPSPWSGLFAFTRPDSPFTPAERARAYRLAQIAETAALVQNRKR